MSARELLNKKQKKRQSVLKGKPKKKKKKRKGKGVKLSKLRTPKKKMRVVVLMVP